MEYQLIKSSLPQEEKFRITAVERVLTNRGIKLEDVNHYLNTTDEDILDYNLIDNLKQGAQMLAKHINNQDNIYLIVDCDADGFTSAALLINYLNLIFPGYVQHHIYYELHEEKIHGIENNFIPEILARQCSLVICPDAASNDYEAHKILKENNVDVLVIDHHIAEKISEDACIINNQLCNYPNKTLSGVGMVYKFCCYLDKLLGLNNADLFLDLVAVGMIADQMDLKNFETKHLIFKGLKQIRNPFISEMAKAQNYNINKHGGLNPYTIGFYIAPFINAITRTGTIGEKKLVFEAMLDYIAYNTVPSTKRGCKGQYETHVAQACRVCNNVKNRQTKLRDNGIVLVEKKIKNEDLNKNKIIVVELEENDISPNLAGLIANMIMNKYQKSTLILRKVVDTETGEIFARGSGRGYETQGFKNLLQFLENSKNITMARGHEMAMGVELPSAEISEFIQETNEKLADCDFSLKYNVDFIWDSNDFTAKDIIDLSALNNISGQGLNKPLIALENIRLTKDNLFLNGINSNPTLKISLSNGVNLIKFGFNADDFDKLKKQVEEKDCFINVVGSCEINEWNGKIYGQILIEDYEIKEITSWLDYF